MSPEELLNLSDEELMRRVQPQQEKAPEDMTDDELLAAYRQQIPSLPPEIVQSKPDQWDMGSLGRAAAQGLTFNSWDEAEGFLKSAYKGTDYKAERDRIRGEMKAYEEANPGTAITAEVLGGMVAPGLGISAVARAKGPLTRLGGYAGVGATEGALSGAGSAGEMDDVTQRAIHGAMYGAPAGVAGGAVGELVGRGVQKLMPGTNMKQQMRSAFEGVDPRAPQRELGPRAMALNTNDEATTLAEGIAVQGRDDPAVRRAFEGQRAGIDRDIADQQASGVNRVIQRDRMESEKAARGRANYGAAMDQPRQVDLTGKLGTPLGNLARVKSEAGKKAYSEALRILKEHKGLKQDMTPAEADALYKSLQDAQGSIPPKSKYAQKMFGDVVRAVRTELHKIPEYKEAARQWAIDEARLRAGEVSDRLFTPSYTPSRLAADISKEPPEFAEELARLMPAAFEEAIGNTPNKGLSKFKTPNVQKKLLQAFGPQRGPQLIKDLNARLKMASDARRVSGGSDTARRQGLKEKLGPMTFPTVATTIPALTAFGVTSSGPLAATAAGTGALLGLGREGLRRRAQTKAMQELMTTGDDAAQVINKYSGGPRLPVVAPGLFGGGALSVTDPYDGLFGGE